MALLSVTQEFVEAYIQRDPQAVARLLEIEQEHEVAELLSGLPEPMLHAVFSAFVTPYAAACAAHMDEAKVGALIQNFDIHSLTNFLRASPRKLQKQWFKHLPAATVKTCQQLLTYNDNMIGACMRVDIFYLPDDITMPQALQRVFKTNLFFDSEMIPVVDKDSRVVGHVDIKQLLQFSKVAGPNQDALEEPVELHAPLLRSSMQRKSPTLFSRMTIASVVNHEHWNRFDCVYVLNRNRQLVGVLRHCDLRSRMHVSQFSEEQETADNIVASLSEMYGGVLVSLVDVLGNSVVKSESHIKNRGQVSNGDSASAVKLDKGVPRV